MKAVAKLTFPTNRLFYSPISLSPFYHLSLSSYNDPINDRALFIFFFV